MEDIGDALTAALERVGPRLQALRMRRGIPLSQVAESTGISKSTLSRLENGRRRPSLELLLPLARAYRVSLDELVGAPETGDPRVRLRPRRVNGRTVVPLTRQSGERHAWKIIVPQCHDSETHLARGFLVDVRPVGARPPHRRRPRCHARRRRGRGVRHPYAPLVRQRR